MRNKSKSKELASLPLLSDKSISIELPTEFKSSSMPELSEVEDCFLRRGKAVDEVPPGVRPVQLRDNGEP